MNGCWDGRWNIRGQQLALGSTNAPDGHKAGGARKLNNTAIVPLGSGVSRVFRERRLYLGWRRCGTTML